MNQPLTLKNLPLNTPAIISHIEAKSLDPLLKNRLEAMGFMAGNTVKVLRKSWGGSPLQIQVGLTTLVAVRGAEADLIIICN